MVFNGNLRKSQVDRATRQRIREDLPGVRLAEHTMPKKRHRRTGDPDEWKQLWTREGIVQMQALCDEVLTRVGLQVESPTRSSPAPTPTLTRASSEPRRQPQPSPRTRSSAVNRTKAHQTTVRGGQSAEKPRRPPQRSPGPSLGRRQRRKGSGSTRVNLSLDDVAISQLDELSERWGLSKSAVISLLIRRASGIGVPDLR